MEEAPICRDHGPKTKRPNRSKPRGWVWECCECTRARNLRWRTANHQKHRAQLTRWQAANPEKLHASRMRAVERNRAFVAAEAERRSKGFCEYEGCNAPGTEWHHRDPATKLFKIGDAVNSGWSYARLSTELARCDLVCGDHHKLIHWVLRHLPWAAFNWYVPA